LSGNRLGQVVVPATVAALTGVLGIGVAFVSIGVGLAASAVVLLWADFGLPEEPEV
jgi:hypothetical protein